MVMFRIWSTDAIYNAGDPNYSKPRQLASISPNGKLLASGADDKIVCVYTPDPNPPSHSAKFGTYTELCIRFHEIPTKQASRFQ